MRKLIVISAIGAVALGAVAVAGEKGDWEAKLDAMFTEADADGDASLSQTEFVDYHAAKASEHFAEMAGDDDSLTADEAKAYYTAKMEEKKDDKESHEGHDGQ